MLIAKSTPPFFLVQQQLQIIFKQNVLDILYLGDCALKKYHMIEFYRVVATLIICTHHSQLFAGHLYHGYLAVEFFFIVSGFMLYQSLQLHSKSTKDFILSKYIRFYPEYFFAMIIYSLALLIHNIKANDMHNIHTIMMRLIPETLLVQNISIWGGGNNYPLWYLPVLIWGGALIYFLLKHFEKGTIYFIAPAFILIYYIYLFSTSDNIESFDYIWLFSNPFLRGTADMFLGTIIYKIWIQIRNKKYIDKLSFIEQIIGAGGILWCIFSKPFYDKYIFIFMTILLFGALSSNLHFSCIDKFSRYLFSIYVNHAFVICLLSHFTSNASYIQKIIIYFLYLLVLVTYSVLTYTFIHQIIRLMSNKFIHPKAIKR